MRKFFGKFVSVTLAAAVIAMFALSSDDKWCAVILCSGSAAWSFAW